MAAAASPSPRYEVDERPPFRTTMGYGIQLSLIASATLLVPPVMVTKASGRDDAYLVWIVFASLIVIGVSTLLQTWRLGPIGAGAVSLMFTAAIAIPFYITAVVDGGRPRWAQVTFPGNQAQHQGAHNHVLTRR